MEKEEVGAFEVEVQYYALELIDSFLFFEVLFIV